MCISPCILCRHLEQFWGASKTFWSSLWAVVYGASGESHFLMFTFGEFTCIV